MPALPSEEGEKMSPSIHIAKCAGCPYYAFFPAEYFDGECTNKESSKNTRDTRLTNKDKIPKWCPL
jgi:hypothetical protein